MKTAEQVKVTGVVSGAAGLLVNPDVCVEDVLGFSFCPLIHRMIDKYGWTLEDAEQAFFDMKMFLYLCGAGTTGPYTPSPRIDEMWHNFILFTEDYILFCKKHFGRFIHHRPRRRDDPVSSRDSVGITVQTATRIFGKLSSSWDYPRAIASGSDCRQECDGCRTCDSCQDKECHDS